MNIIKSITSWAALIFIIALTGMSILSAFIGPSMSSIFFGCPSMVIFWLLVIILLFVSISVFFKTMTKSGTLLIHIGCILILSGALACSPKGQDIIHKLTGTNKIAGGTIMVYEQSAENNVWPANQPEPFTLPFSLKLKNLRIDFYEPGYLFVRTPEKQHWRLPVIEQKKYVLDPNVGSIKIQKVYRNFRITTVNGSQRAYDSNEPGSNPAVLIEYKTPKGSVVDKFIFAKFDNPVFEDDMIYVDYKLNVKQVYSDIEIIKDGKVFKTATIAVNGPLHFGGYHFYQNEYDAVAEKYALLGVVSDTGLYAVYAGYALLCAGALRHFWFRHLWRKKFNAMI